MVNNIVMIIAGVMFFSPLGVILVEVWKTYSPFAKKITVTSKTGETAELNLKGKNDVNELIRFVDVLLDHK